MLRIDKIDLRVVVKTDGPPVQLHSPPTSRMTRSCHFPASPARAPQIERLTDVLLGFATGARTGGQARRAIELPPPRLDHGSTWVSLGGEFLAAGCLQLWRL